MINIKGKFLVIFGVLCIALNFGCSKKEKIELTNVEIPESKYLFPTNPGSVLIYGHPLSTEVIVNSFFFVDKENILNLIEMYCGIKKLDLKSIYKSAQKQKKNNAEIYIIKFTDPGYCLDGEPLEQVMRKNFLLFSNPQIRICKLIQSVNNIFDVKIEKLQEQELKKIDTAVKERIKNIKIKIVSSDKLYWPLDHTGIGKGTMKEVNTPKMVKYSHYLFPIDSSLTISGVTTYFTKGIGVIARMVEDKEGETTKSLVGEAGVYRKFYDDGKNLASQNHFLGNRILYFFIPDNNRDYEFYDDQFFTKSKTGEILMKKEPSRKSVL